MDRNEVVLTDGMVLLRAATLEDVSAFHAAVRESLPELSRWLAWAVEEYTRDHALQYIQGLAGRWERDETYEMVIFDAASGEILGGVGLNGLNRLHRMANLGYWVRTSRSRRGVASRAARLLARFGMGQLGFSRIEIVAAVGNLPSQRAAEKAGATREGVLRNRLVVQGQSTDAVMFSLLPGDVGL